MRTIYVACPRQHRYRIGRFTPGLFLRIKGYCPVCRDAQITTGVVTPFSDEIVALGQPHQLTPVTSDVIRRQLGPMAGRADVARLLERLPGDSAHLSIRDVAASMELWLRHKGTPGGAIPERNQTIEIMGGSDDPRASVSFLREQLRGRTRAGAPPVVASSGWGEQLLGRVPQLRDVFDRLLLSARRELSRLAVRIGL